MSYYKNKQLKLLLISEHIKWERSDFNNLQIYYSNYPSYMKLMENKL